mgnify:CR=1 FL=1
MRQPDLDQAPTVSTRTVACALCGSHDIAETVCETRDFCYETCANSFRYVRCAGCDNLYLANRPDLCELSVIYPQNYLTYDYESSLGPIISALRNKVQAKKIKPIARYAQDDDIILDVGCGAGDFLELIQRFGAPGWRAIGIDFSPQAVARARSKGLEVIEGRIEDMADDRPEGVGVIVMNQLIEHVEDPQKVMTICHDMLRPGGVLILETPNPNAWEAVLFRARYWGGWHAPRHWNIFTPEPLGKAAAACGLEPLGVEYTLNPFSWLHSIQYLLRERFGWDRVGRLSDVDRFVPLALASSLDVVQKAVTGRTSNQRLIFTRRD